MAAKWLHPILFCNDINLKTLVDITLYDEEHMLITCRSFIKRFNFVNRKQVNNWITTSWHVFSSGAIKLPKTDIIYAVVKNSTLCHWPVEEKDIQNFKKNVFKSQIQTLIPGTDTLYIVYCRGYVEPLESGRKSRKELKPQLIKPTESIIQSHIFESRKEAALLTRNEVGDIFLYHVKISSSEALCCSHIKAENFQLTGSLFLPLGELLTTWSDGNLYSMDTLSATETATPGSIKGRLKDLKANKRTKILNLSHDHIALLGMNINEEGGLLVLFETKFNLVVGTKPMKMYKDPPLAWTIPSGVVAADGGSLVYAPVSLSPSSVSSMLGCRINETYFDDVCIGWSGLAEGDHEPENEIPISAVKTVFSNKSKALSNIIRELHLGTVSEDIIVNDVIHSLIEAKNVELLSECISSFSFVPEKSLVSILKFLLELSDEFFPKEEVNEALPEEQVTENFPKEQVKKKQRRKRLSTSISQGDCAVMTNGELLSDEKSMDLSMDLDVAEKSNDGDTKKEFVCPFSRSKCISINNILVQPFSSEIMREEIMALEFKISLELIQYLHYLLASGEAHILDKKSGIPTLEKTSLWLGLLFDSNYQHFVMASEVEIYRMLMTIFNDISSLLGFWEASHSIDILVERVKASDLIPTSQANSSYSIERLVL